MFKLSSQSILSESPLAKWDPVWTKGVYPVCLHKASTELLMSPRVCLGPTFEIFACMSVEPFVMHEGQKHRG